MLQDLRISWYASIPYARYLERKQLKPRPGGRDRKRNKFTAHDYLSELNSSFLTGTWMLAGIWHRVHGDGKSSTGGRWHIEKIATSTGAYKTRLMQDNGDIFSKPYLS